MPIGPRLTRWLVLLWFALCVPSFSNEPLPVVAAKETLHYAVEWRLVRAGNARVTWTPGAGNPSAYQGGLHLESAGLVSKLYRVNDDYVVHVTEQLCAQSILLKAEEGKRRRETRVAIAKGKASYNERDLIKNATVLAKEIEVPACVQDVVSGLYKLRTLGLQPGQSATIPVTDGKKLAQVRVEAQEKEVVKTPTGNHNTVKHEAFIFNNVLFSRNGRCFVWLTDDARRTPVQIQVKMRFIIGTITLTLEKQERG